MTIRSQFMILKFICGLESMHHDLRFLSMYCVEKLQKHWVYVTFSIIFPHFLSWWCLFSPPFFLLFPWMGKKHRSWFPNWHWLFWYHGQLFHRPLDCSPSHHHRLQDSPSPRAHWWKTSWRSCAPVSECHHPHQPQSRQRIRGQHCCS